MITLDTLKVGMSGVIVDLVGNRTFLSRASGIGFTLGVNVTAIRNDRGYPVLVYLRDTEVAIDRNEARRIYIDADD